MSLRDLIASDVTDVFINSDDFAEPITYRQGTPQPLEVDGIFHEVEYEVADAQGYLTKFVSTDVAIPATQLGAVEPRPGDVIERTVGAKTWVYTVLPIDDKRPCASLDVSNSIWTVHSKRTR